jgi:hypothetical protein
MIVIDYGETQDGPTVWLVIDSVAEFTSFHELVAQLSHGDVVMVDCRKSAGLFSLMPDVSNLLLNVVPANQNSRVELANDEHGRLISWKLSRDGWQEALALMEGLAPASHQYFDYPKATVIVSMMEDLKRG